MSHHVEYCTCGASLKHVAEKESGMCVTCMISEDHIIDRMCSECGDLVSDPSELVNGCCPSCFSEYNKQYNAVMDREHEQDVGLMRDSMRAEGRACDIPATWRR